MERSTTDRKNWLPEDDHRGVVCRWYGCKHFRLVYTRPTWGGRIPHGRECGHCGRRITMSEKAGA